MATIQSPTDFNVLLGGLSPDQIIQLTKYLNDIQMPVQMRSQNVQSSQLLRLPQELRDNIMRMTIGNSVNVDPWNVSAEATPTMAWMQVCSQLRLDAAQVYFRTPIYLPYVKDEVYKKWVDSIDVHYRSFVRSVHIDRFFPDTQKALEYTAKQDAVGAFNAGTVWVASSEGEGDNETSIWLNALGETKLYTEMLPLEACLSSAISDKFDLCGWD